MSAWRRNVLTDSTSIRNWDSAIVPRMLTAPRTPAICQPSNVRAITTLSSCQACTRARATSSVRLGDRASRTVQREPFSTSRRHSAHRVAAACWIISQCVRMMLYFCHTFTIAITTTSATEASRSFVLVLLDSCSILHRASVMSKHWPHALLHHGRHIQSGRTKKKNDRCFWTQSNIDFFNLLTLSDAHTL